MHDDTIYFSLPSLLKKRGTRVGLIVLTTGLAMVGHGSHTWALAYAIAINEQFGLTVHFVSPHRTQSRYFFTQPLEGDYAGDYLEAILRR